MRSFIFVHQQALGRNRKSGSTGPVEPPLRVRQKSKSLPAYLIEAAGDGTSTIRYTLDNPLKNGVRVYIETDLDVKIFATYSVPVPRSPSRTIHVNKINNRKREPHLIPITTTGTDGKTQSSQCMIIHGSFRVVYRHENERQRIAIETNGLIECK